jgi:hypothetical protein
VILLSGVLWYFGIRQVVETLRFFWRRKAAPTEQVLLIFWLVLSYLAIFIGWRFPGHYHLPVLPPLSILAGQAFSRFVAEERRFPQRHWRWIRTGIVGAAALPAIVFLIVAFVGRTQMLNFLLPARASLPRQHIGNSCRYSSSCGCIHCYGAVIGGSGRFRDRGIGFIGFAFNRGARIQYGWARVRKSGPPDYRFVLLDYAWGDPGDKIKTGQRSSSGEMVDTVTDSGSVGLLALGAAGLTAWQKRRGQVTD